MEYDVICHHGVKGMRWGIRRFQKKDGSLTLAGKRRRRAEDAEKEKDQKAQKAKAKAEAKVQKKQAKEQIEKEKKLAEEQAKKQKETETVEERRARLLKSTNAQELYEGRKYLTTAELNERINRMDVEQRLGAKAQQNKKTWTDRVDKVLSVGKKVNEIYEFTNTPVMKALKKKISGETEKKTFDLDKAVRNIDNMSDKEVNDLMKRLVATEKIFEKANALRGRS